MRTRLILSLTLPLLISGRPARAQSASMDWPWPAAEADARTQHIAVSGFDLPGADDRPHIGDSVTLLVTLTKQGRDQQWLAVLTSGALTPHEIGARPPIADSVRYTTTGNELHYPVRNDAALSLAFLGPYSDALGRTSEMKPEFERILVNSEFLGFGLDRTCQIWVRLQDRLRALRAAGELRGDVLLPLETSVRPFADSTVNQTRALAAKIGFTTDDERPFYGMEFALESFLQLIEGSHGAAGISDQIIARPPWWARFTGLGVEPKITTEPASIRAVDGREWHITSDVYRLPIAVALDGKPALQGAMIVTAPRPPLRVCAGILGFAASPSQDPNSRLAVTVIAARRGIQPLPSLP